ncbi:hypothetical protein SRIMM317S_03863 [Streptomyces rimosus subsp. rimosus]
MESSSGNLGVALAMIAADRGYRFLCVTDARCNVGTRRLMEAMGAEVHTVDRPDEQGGYLGARLRYVRERCASDARYVWLNQYTNPYNALRPPAHHRPRDRPAVPGPGRALRRRGHHRHADGVRPLLPAVDAPGDRGGRGRGRFGDLRRAAGAPV